MAFMYRNLDLQYMYIIADSGGTKTEWRSVGSDGTVRSAQTVGMNPSCMDTYDCRAVVREAVPVLNPTGEHVESVFFYGAGLVSEDATAPVREALEMWCPFAQIHFHSDLLAAARALFGNGTGIAAIVGTGSNSCLYENGEIVSNIRPGGFILGDEGSGAALGKAFIADFVKGMMPSEIETDFISLYGLDYPSIVRKVYREPAASAFLASFAPFLIERIAHPYVRDLVSDCMESFVRRSLARYGTGIDIGVVGSLGCACEEILRVTGRRYGLEFVKFLKSPIDELVKYHGI